MNPRVPSVRTLTLLRDLYTLHVLEARDAQQAGSAGQARHLRAVADSIAATAAALYRRRAALLASPEGPVGGPVGEDGPRCGR